MISGVGISIKMQFSGFMKMSWLDWQHTCVYIIERILRIIHYKVIVIALLQSFFCFRIIVRRLSVVSPLNTNVLERHESK